MLRALTLALPLTAACGDKSDDTASTGSPDGGSNDGGSADGGGAVEQIGELLYAENCAEFHGAKGHGTGSGPNLTFEVQSHTDEQIIAVMLNGQKDMPAVEVAEEQAQMIVDHLHELFGS